MALEEARKECIRLETARINIIFDVLELLNTVEVRSLPINEFQTTGGSMSKPFAFLRAKMVEADVDQEHLGEIIHRSLSAVNRRMNNKEDWTQSEQYTIMDMLHISYDQMHLVFPKDGKMARRST